MLRRLGTAGITFAVALGSGYLLQSGGLNPEPTVPAETLEDATITPLTGKASLKQPETPRALRPLALPDLPRTPTSLLQPDPNLANRIAGVDRHWQGISGASLARYDDFGKTCPPTNLSLTPAEDGMMTVHYANPCDAGARLIVQHDAIAADLVADAQGRATVSLPVLDTVGRVTVLSDTGQDTTISRSFAAPAVPRVVVTSETAGAFRLASGNAVPIGDRDAPLVWTEMLQNAAQPLLQATVTPQTCGQDLAAHIRFIGLRTEATEITVAMPDCTAVGQTVLVPLSPATGDRYAAEG